MAFADDEKSLYGAAPIELYKFIGTSTTYKMTSYSQPVTSGVDVYTPLEGLKRTVLKVGNQEEESLALDIELPFDHPMVVEYAYQSAPPSLELELRRAHKNNPSDSILMWSGKVISFAVVGRVAKLRVPSLFAYLLDTAVPSVRYQAPCNHWLYDGRCQVSDITHRHVTTVTAVSTTSISLASNTFADGQCDAGDMTFTGSGESRMITSNTGLDFVITYPFSNLQVGDGVVIRRGCDHSFSTCKSKFSNGVNFMGFPLVPSRNPFSSKL